MKDVLSRKTTHVVLPLLNDYCPRSLQPGPNTKVRLSKAENIVSACWATMLFTAGSRRGLEFAGETFGQIIGGYAERTLNVRHVVAQCDDFKINNTVGEVRKAIAMIDATCPDPSNVTLYLVSNKWHLRRTMTALRWLYPELYESGVKIIEVPSADTPQYFREIAFSWPLLLLKRAGLLPKLF